MSFIMRNMSVVLCTDHSVPVSSKVWKVVLLIIVCSTKYGACVKKMNSVNKNLTIKMGASSETAILFQ